jgi:hypothetical protein
MTCWAKVHGHWRDAKRYFKSYADAIAAIGKSADKVVCRTQAA